MNLKIRQIMIDFTALFIYINDVSNENFYKLSIKTNFEISINDYNEI